MSMVVTGPSSLPETVEPPRSYSSTWGNSVLTLTESSPEVRVTTFSGEDAAEVLSAAASAGSAGPASAGSAGPAAAGWAGAGSGGGPGRGWAGAGGRAGGASARGGAG